ncbi:MAG TPA: rod shape-determining protein MreC [Ferruginibacter sp.]|mgnify:CR=1 FL=1|nr:rod shape-determining protein MreC [Ferruginibacter sp.]HRQ21270.1 rod shape-determining protein MreC [Ferruginibacter sp.]
MRNIFLFIRRYFNFLLFIFLQMVCVYFIVSYSKFHEAAFGKTANQITGKINKRYSNIQYYFNLRKTNDSLVKANERLYNQLRLDRQWSDSIQLAQIDSLFTDSLVQASSFVFRGARVVSNAVSTPNNFIVLDGGSAKGFHKGMGVISAEGGVVGIITETSTDFSVVMSLLHKDSRISGKIFKTGETGTVTWDGEQPNVLYMNGIAKSVKVAKGDSIITSGFSTTFPKGLLIGRVEGAYAVPNTNFIKIKITTHTNFYNIQHAYTIENKNATAVNELLKHVQKQLQ